MKSRFCLLLLGAVVLAACESPTGDTVPKFPLTPDTSTAALSLHKPMAESGDGQTGEVGTTLPKPLRVLVTAGGVPKAGVTVVWALPDGQPNHPPASVTDINGIATTNYTLSTRAGVETVDAGFVGNVVPGRAQFTFIATAAAAAMVVKLTGDQQQITATPGDPTLPLMVIAHDRYGNATPLNGTVNWSVIDGPLVIDRVQTDGVTGVGSATIRTTGTAGVARVRAVVWPQGAVAATSLEFTIYVTPRVYTVTIHGPDDDTTTVFRSETSGRIPALDTVKTPATIRFVHDSYWDQYTRAQHRIVWPNLEFPASPLLTYGQSHSVTLTVPGVYHYRSTWNPRLTGTVVVQ
jgi:plastocyanin